MAERELTIRIRIGRREAVALLALALVALHPGSLSTEQLTLTTYYPSPYGVYSQLRSTTDAYLAYTSGNVGVGTNSPQGKLHVAGGGNVILNTSGNVGIGTTNPQAKLHLQQGGENILFDGGNGVLAIGTVDTSEIYATGIKVAGSNVHVQGNENGSWLRVGDAWNRNGIYSEAGDLILGAGTGMTTLGWNNDGQFMGQMCRSVWYSFGGETTCPNGGRGWTILGYSSSPGRIDGGAIPLSGYMHCCKIETP